MIPRYWNIRYSNLAFVTPSKFNPVSWNVLYQHHTLYFFTSPFKYQIISFWLLNWKKFSLLVIYLYNHWQLEFTYFTFKFIKVKVDGPTNCFFLNFNVNPFSEALNMNSTTRTSTKARIKKEVIRSISLIETYFTSIFRLLIFFRSALSVNFKNFTVEIFLPVFGSFSDNSIFLWFANKILYSSKFDGMARA